MPRAASQSERESATLVAIEGQSVPLDDVEQAFDDWRSSFDNAEEPGKIRAFEIPLDERGTPMMSAKTQTRLGAWAIDLYTFDELCNMIIRDFMLPTGQRIMAVRFLGTKAGVQGVQFNKIVILRPPAAPPNNPSAAQPESTATLLKAIQDMNERTMVLMQRLTPSTAPRDAMDEMLKMAQFMQQLNAPMISLLTAMVGKPGGTSDPFAGLESAIRVIGSLDDLRQGGSGGGGDGDSDLVGVLKAVAPLAAPVLQALPAILAQQSRPVLRPPIEHAPPAPGAQPSKSAAPSRPAASPTDIPTGDQEMFAQLKPQIDSLVEMAKQGSDPAAAADLLFDQVIIELPDVLYGRVADLIGQENFLRNAAVFNPAVGAYEVFFKAFQAQIVKRIEQEDSAAGQEPSA